jgi:hypothetical protein
MTETQTLEILNLLKKLPSQKVVEVRKFVLSLQKDSKETPSVLLSQIASMPNENNVLKFDGRDHDEILYGKKQ